VLFKTVKFALLDFEVTDENDWSGHIYLLSDVINGLTTELLRVSRAYSKLAGALSKDGLSMPLQFAFPGVITGEIKLSYVRFCENVGVIYSIWD
jgi:hypothetical protein